MSAASQSARPRQHWRENIEAFTVAIVMAVMLKYFAVEAYQIPTGSMQPTLMGQDFGPEGAIKDRILVDKLSFHMRDPQRWEVVIFKYPLNRAQNFVKRLVGMPGEQLRIQHGDVWTRASDSENWRIPRRPANVQRTHWKAIDVGAPAGGASWKSEPGSTATITGRDVSASAPARVGFSAHGSGSILDTYTHGYPAGMRAKLQTLPQHRASNRHPVGDLRVSGKLTCAGDDAVAIVLREGKRSYRFELGGGKARIAIEWAPNEGFEPRQIEAPLTLARGSAFAVENLDDALALEVDGEVVLSLPGEPAADQSSSVALSFERGAARFEDLQVERDVYYTPGGWSDSWTIPAGHYFMLGDNTQDSSDSREWRRIQMKWSGSPAGDEPIAGNLREGQPGRYSADTNPIVEGYGPQQRTYFRDLFGELHHFENNQRIELPGGSAVSPSPLVPRHLITGRAVAVFWPLSWKYSTYRLQWVR